MTDIREIFERSVSSYAKTKSTVHDSFIEQRINDVYVPPNTGGNPPGEEPDKRKCKGCGDPLPDDMKGEYCAKCQNKKKDALELRTMARVLSKLK